MNIASDEDSSFDMILNWIKPDQLYINIKLNEDGMGDTEIDYTLTRNEVEFLRDVLTGYLESEPKA